MRNCHERGNTDRGIRTMPPRSWRIAGTGGSSSRRDTPTLPGQQPALPEDVRREFNAADRQAAAENRAGAQLVQQLVGPVLMAGTGARYRRPSPDFSGWVLGPVFRCRSWADIPEFPRLAQR